ncbi:sterol carrier protein domain-containing protein, partial [Saccharopolyspora kobensis]
NRRRGVLTALMRAQLEALHENGTPIAAPVDVVLDVTDRFCPWNEGRWRLRTDAAGSATAIRTEDAGQLSLDITDLAAAYLGGSALAALARSGRVVEHEPGALVATPRAFATDCAPHCQEGF